jgi:hypothetical protein
LDCYSSSSVAGSYSQPAIAIDEEGGGNMLKMKKVEALAKTEELVLDLVQAANKAKRFTKCCMPLTDRELVWNRLDAAISHYKDWRSTVKPVLHRGR